MMRSDAELLAPALPALVSAGVLLAGGAVLLGFVQLDALSALMVQHLLIMNVIAPLGGAVIAARRWRMPGSDGLLWAAAIAQLLLLWSWHAPPVQQAAGNSAALHLLLLAPLAAASLLFWAVLLRAGAQGRWSAIAALLVTGKLACLLGGLMIFAPREIYGLASLAISICTAGPSTLADQQLAGLMMIVACPLSYVLAGVIMAARMIGRLERRSAAGFAIGAGGVT